MIEFCKWIESIGLCYSFHRIEDIFIFAENKVGMVWAFLRNSAINTANLKKVNPKIIELKGAYLNIGFPFKSINKEILYVENKSIYFDLTTLPIEELERLMRVRIFNQNIGFILTESNYDFSFKTEVLRKSILGYCFDKNLDAIRANFFKEMVSEQCFLPIIATNLYEDNILILVSNEKLRDSIDIIPDSYDRIKVPFSLKMSDLSYFYKW